MLYLGLYQIMEKKNIVISVTAAVF